jgi:hypothetical protein
MPYALSPPVGYDTGKVSTDNVPLSKFLSTSFDQGVHDSMFNSIMEITEQSITSGGRLLQKDEANKLYGLPTLKFDGEIDENSARILNERKAAELKRQYYLSEGNRKGLFSARGAAGMGAGMLGSMLNPLDFSMNFMPVVGSEAAASKMALAGAGVVRQGLARGFITAESLGARAILTEEGPAIAHTFKSGLADSLIQGFVGNAVAEIPHVINEIRSKGNYTVDESLVNVITGTALGGAIHMGLTAAARTLAKAHQTTHEAAFRKAMDDVLSGRDPRVQELVSIDEAVIRDKVKFDAQVARERILQSIPMDEIKAAIKEKYGEVPISVAVKLADGTILRGKPGQLHVMIDGVADVPLEQWLNADLGFITNKGRFISGFDPALEAMTGKQLGPGQRFTSEELTYIDPDFLTPEELLIFDDAKANMGTDAHGVNAVRQYRRQKADAAFFERPEIQAMIAKEQEDRINTLLEQERQSWDEEGRFKKEYRAEMEKQIAEGKTITPEQAKQWGFEDKEKSNSTMKEQETELTQQIKELADELDEEISDTPESESKLKIEDALEKLKVKIKPGDTLEGVTGMPVILWNGAIDAVIAAIKAGRAIKEAIEAGVKYLRDQEKETMFHSAIQAELAKEQPFNVKPDRFTPRVIMSRLKNLPAPEQAMLKMAGIDEFMKQYKPTEMIDRVAFQKFVDAAIIQPEIKPMLNVAEYESGHNQVHTPYQQAQHYLETQGYIFDSTGAYRRPPYLDHYGLSEKPTVDEIEKVVRSAWNGRDIRTLSNEKAYIIGKTDKITPRSEDQLRGEYVSQNVSVPIAFDKMVKPRTIFLAADQDVHVGSSHYEGVFSTKSVVTPTMVEDEFIGRPGLFVKENGNLFMQGKKGTEKQLAQRNKEQWNNFYELRTIRKGDRWNTRTEIPNKKDMLAWMETHVVTLPDGRRVLHVFEAQSDVRQSFNVEELGSIDSAPGERFDAHYLDEKGHDANKSFDTAKEAQSFVDQKLKEYQERVQPLIDHTDEILMKAALKLAKREGLDGVVISDPRTAMLTQGHLGHVSYKDEKTGNFWDADELEAYKANGMVDENQQLGTPFYTPPSQAAGMAQAYGEKLPSILKKATSKEGEQVDLGGKHYNASGLSAWEINEAGLIPDAHAPTPRMEGFNKLFPGSDSPSGKFFPVQHLPDKPFGTFTPKQTDLVTPKQIEQFKEIVGKKLGQEKPKEAPTSATPKEKSTGDMSRRSFIDIIGRVAGAAGITPTSMAMDLLKGVNVEPVKVVEKTLLPSMTLSDLQGLMLAKQVEVENAFTAQHPDLWDEFHGWGDPYWEKDPRMQGLFDSKLSKLQYFLNKEDAGLSPIVLSAFPETPELKKIASEIKHPELEGVGLEDRISDFMSRLEYGSLTEDEGKIAYEALKKFQTTPLSELESSGKISKDIASKISSAITDVTTLYPDILDKMKQLMEPEAVKIASKEIDTVAKGTSAGIDAAVNCLTNLKL